LDLLVRAVVRIDSSSEKGNFGKRITEDFTLFQNYPNPFNAITIIPFHLKIPGIIYFKIIDSNGRLIKNLGRFNLVPAEYHFLKWDGTNNAGNKVASGIYMIVMETSSSIITKNAIFLK
jgi:hypothetical protein